MSWIHQLCMIFLGFWRRKQVEAELNAEVQSFYEIAVAREIDKGLTKDDAQRNVRLRFDGPEQVKQHVRDSQAGAPLEVVLQDLTYAWRSLRRNPAYAITAICTLALGIGANTVMFSVISGVILRPLPFSDPGRIVQLNETDAKNGVGPVSYADLQDWREDNSSFESMIAYGNTSRDLQSHGEPERIFSVWAERGLFQTLGATPLLGRTFRADDPLQVVVLSASLWRSHFAGESSCVGQKLVLDNEAYTVIGVMPDDFQFPYQGSRPLLWIPWELPPQYAHDRNYRVDFAMGRVKRDVGLNTAQNELHIIAERIERNFPETNKDRKAVLTPFSEVVTGRIRPVLLTLFGVVGMVLLIACANVANLLLARMARRTHEIAVRAALGASKSRLIQQVLTESLLLSALGGIAGLLLAFCGTRLLLALASARIPRASEIGLDWRVFCFLAVVSFGVGIVFGLAPALTVSHVDVQPMIKKDYESGCSGNRRYRWRTGNLRDLLVVAEIAMAFVLLTGADLLLQAFLRLQATPSGLTTDRVLTLHMGVELRNYAERGSYDRYLQRLEERLNTVPGVRAVGFIQFLPLQNWGWTGGFAIIGNAPTEQGPRAELRYISPGYFHAFGIPLRKGRMFSKRDTSESPPVILINEALARRYFNNEDPIGKRTDRGTIVGIVGDVRQSGLGWPAAPEIYYPFAQNTAARSDEGVSLIVKTLGPPEAMTNAVRIAIHQVNPNQAISDVRSMEKVVFDSLADLDLYLWLVGVFAAIAAILASAGIYGVISYALATRIREFAIRLALGADKRALLKLVLGHGGRLIVGGIVLGSAGAFALQHILRRFVFSVPALNPVMLFEVSVLFAVLAIAACAGPAAKATRLDPNVNLRSE